MTMGISFFTVFLEIFIGQTIAVMPTMTRTLKMLLPTTLPTARSGVFLKADMRLTKSSGAEVPIATIVRPMMNWGILRRSAMPTAPSVRRSAPHTMRMMPRSVRPTAMRMSIVISDI